MSVCICNSHRLDAAGGCLSCGRKSAEQMPPTPIANDEELMARLNEAALELRRLGLSQEADNLLAVDDRIATLSAENAQLKAQVAERDEAMSAATAVASGPNGNGGMRVVVHFPLPGDETALFHYLTAALQPKAEARHD